MYQKHQKTKHIKNKKHYPLQVLIQKTALTTTIKNSMTKKLPIKYNINRYEIRLFSIYTYFYTCKYYHLVTSYDLH